MEGKEKVKVKFSVEKELAEKFVLATKLNKENSINVLKQLMMEYVSESFSKASKNVSGNSPVSSNTTQLSTKGKQSFLEGNDIGNATTKITNEMVKITYEYAKKVFIGKLTRQEGKLIISKETGMNPGSAQDYITCFLSMMEGKEYHRTISNLGTLYFLENIRKDYGETAFQIALESTEKHIKYYNSLGYGKLKAKEDIVRRMRETM